MTYPNRYFGLVFLVVTNACGSNGDPFGTHDAAVDAVQDTTTFDGSTDAGTMDGSADAAEVTDGSIDTVDAPLDSPAQDTGADAFACLAQENCGPQGRGNGLDDNCSGQVDEGCSQCQPGEARACYTGPLDQLNVGACRAGLFVCDDSPSCEGSVLPSTEVCNRVDDDCDSRVDEGLNNCTRRLVCPPLVTGRPLTTVLLNSSPFSSAGASNVSFRVECPPNIPVERCPAVQGQSFYAAQSGTYTVFATVRYPDNTLESCSWPYVVASGPGLRVELDWNTASGADLDLHLLRYSTNSVIGGENDCFYSNCSSSSTEPLQWGLPNSPLSACSGAPQGAGARWAQLGFCRNPRLDADTNGGAGACNPALTDPNAAAYCAPENINLDNAPPGQVYRVVARHFNGAPQLARVNIYCGGVVRASYSPSTPLQTHATDAGLPFPFPGTTENETWYVADVAFDANGECQLYPLGQIVRGSGAAPAWSCIPNGSRCVP